MNHDKLRQLAQNATPGPWITAPPLSQDGGMFFGTAAEEDATKTDLLLGSVAYARDGEFIAEANPIVVIALLDEIQRLKAERALAWSDGYSTRMRHESEMADRPGYRISWRDGIKQNPHRSDQ